MARSLSLAVVLSLLPCAAASAQDAYTIVLKGAGAGETTVYEDSLTTEMKTRQSNAAGVVVSSRRDHSTRCAVYQETILELDRATRQVKRLRRQCDKATLEMNGKGSLLPFHGKAFVVEKGADGCRVHFEGAAPPEDFVRELEEGFSRKKDVDVLQTMLPKKAVRVGEAWDFDPRPLLEAWPKPPQVRLDTAKASATGKLTKAYKQGDRVFGVLEFRVEVPVGGVAFGSRQAAVEAGTRLTVAVKVEACIDGGASTFTLHLVDELAVRMQLPGPAGQQISGTISEEHVRSETRR